MLTLLAMAGYSPRRATGATLPDLLAVRRAIAQAGRLSRDRLARALSSRIRGRDLDAVVTLLVQLGQVRLERQPGYGRTATVLVWLGDPTLSPPQQRELCVA